MTLQPSKKRKSNAEKTKLHDLLVGGSYPSPAKTTAATLWKRTLANSQWVLMSSTDKTDPASTHLMVLHKEDGAFLSTTLTQAKLVDLQNEQGLVKTSTIGVTLSEFVDALAKGMLERNMVFTRVLNTGVLRTVLYVKDEGFDIDISMCFVQKLEPMVIVGILSGR